MPKIIKITFFFSSVTHWPVRSDVVICTHVDEKRAIIAGARYEWYD